MNSAWARTEPTIKKSKFVKITVLLQFTIKNSKLVCKMSRDGIPKDSTSIANRVFKKLRVKMWDNYKLLLLLSYAVQGSFVKYERV